MWSFSHLQDSWTTDTTSLVKTARQLFERDVNITHWRCYLINFWFVCDNVSYTHTFIHNQRTRPFRRKGRPTLCETARANGVQEQSLMNILLVLGSRTNNTPTDFLFCFFGPIETILPNHRSENRAMVPSFSKILSPSVNFAATSGSVRTRHERNTLVDYVCARSV
jgi:hypothetical protein